MLKNESISLRALEPVDLDIIHAWENDTGLWAASGTTAPFSKYQIWQYLKNYSSDIYEQRQLRMMICLNGDCTPAGMIDLFDFEPHHKRAYVGILVDRHYQRRGIAGQAVGLLAEYARDVLKLHQLAAAISTENTPSLRLFKKSGFTQSGILKEWNATPGGYADQAIMQLLLK